MKHDHYTWYLTLLAIEFADYWHRRCTFYSSYSIRIYHWDLHTINQLPIECSNNWWEHEYAFGKRCECIRTVKSTRGNSISCQYLSNLWPLQYLRDVIDRHTKSNYTDKQWYHVILAYCFKQEKYLYEFYS